MSLNGGCSDPEEKLSGFEEPLSFDNIHFVELPEILSERKNSSPDTEHIDDLLFLLSEDKKLQESNVCKPLITQSFFKDALEFSNSMKAESSEWLNETNYKSCRLEKTNKSWLDGGTYSSNTDRLSKLSNCNIKEDFKCSFVDSNDIFIEDFEDCILNYQPLNFNLLPDEIKLKIFSFFSQRELCRYIAPICRSWFQLAKDSHLWQVILHKDFEDIPSYLFKQVILSWCGNALKIEFNTRTDLLYKDFEDIFEKCNFLEDISFAFCSQIEKNVFSLVNENCKNLKRINIEGCNVQDETFYEFVGLPLESIGVSHCTHITDDGAIFVAKNFNNLCHVNFDGIQWVTNEFVEKLVELHQDTLKFVFLDGENLSDRSVILLSRCPNLKGLSFSFCTSMTENALLSISQCKKLEHLQLRKGENFTNAALIKFFKNMDTEQGTNFKFLNLAECTEITDECLYLIGKRCRKLKHLDLSWCWEISDDGLQFIIDQCSQLKFLHLQGLHELFGGPFTRIPKSLPYLQLMDLSQCNKVPDELIENLVRQMRDLIVYNYYGEPVINRHHYQARAAMVAADDNYWDDCSNSSDSQY